MRHERDDHSPRSDAICNWWRAKGHLSEIELTEVQPRRENALVKALAKAYRWRLQIENGDYASIAELAKAQRVNESYACRLLRLTLLAPEIVVEILNGRQRLSLTLKDLTKPFSLRWDQQLSTFGFF